MKEIEIREYDPTLEQALADMFERYAREDLQDTQLTEEILREKIVRGVLLQNWERGISSIAFLFVLGKPAGFAMYQVDSPESDWCRRPGWGVIREFCILPEFRRRGFGRALAEYAMGRLLKETDRLYLTAHDEAALRFWKACGYVDTGENDKNGCRIMERTQ